MFYIEFYRQLIHQEHMVQVYRNFAATTLTNLKMRRDGMFTFYSLSGFRPLQRFCLLVCEVQYAYLVFFYGGESAHGMQQKRNGQGLIIKLEYYLLESSTLSLTMWVTNATHIKRLCI